MEPITVHIDHRFRGPTTSSNGGYCCGLIGRHIDGAAEVPLRTQPPLDAPLTLAPREGGGLRLTEGERLIAEAKPAALDLGELPPAPTLDEAEATVGYAQNAFPECFVCGRARGHGDGLRLFAGPVEGDGEVMAALFEPDPSLPSEGGALAPEIVWAALDCPGYVAATGGSGAAALLGRMTAELRRPVPADGRYVVAAWPLGAEGRKLFAGTALYSADGALLAASRQIWFTVAV